MAENTAFNNINPHTRTLNTTLQITIKDAGLTSHHHSIVLSGRNPVYDKKNINIKPSAFSSQDKTLACRVIT
jgi:hypothetical protein